MSIMLPVKISGMQTTVSQMGYYAVSASTYVNFSMGLFLSPEKVILETFRHKKRTLALKGPLISGETRENRTLVFGATSRRSTIEL